MDASRWRDLLTHWNVGLLQTPEVVQRLPSDVFVSGWLGYPVAAEEQVRQTEARLGTALPPSYRAFLEVTNGWRHLGHFHRKLWSAEEVDWFRVRNQDWIDAWTEVEAGPAISDEEYFVYGDQQRATTVRVEYMASLLEVSEIGDSVMHEWESDQAEPVAISKALVNCLTAPAAAQASRPCVLIVMCL
jgi:hypothetical protein